ncbi:hypothetical protein ACQJBY_016482 [Aegilops geniculata]
MFTSSARTAPPPPSPPPCSLCLRVAPLCGVRRPPPAQPPFTPLDVVLPVRLSYGAWHLPPDPPFALLAIGLARPCASPTTPASSSALLHLLWCTTPAAGPALWHLLWRAAPVRRPLLWLTAVAARCLEQRYRVALPRLHHIPHRSLHFQ